MLFGPGVRRRRRDHHRVHRQPARASASRGSSRARRRPPRCRRSSASSPSPPPPTRSCGARPSPASRPRRWPACMVGLRPRRACCSSCSGPTAFLLNALVYGASFADLPVRRARRTRSPSRPAARTTRRRGCGGTRGSCAAATSGSSRRPGSPSTRRSACTRARRCSSSSASRTRDFADQQLMGGFDPLQVSRRARDRRPAVLRRPVLLGRQVPDHATDDDHPLRHRGRGRDARAAFRDQPLRRWPRARRAAAC